MNIIRRGSLRQQNLIETRLIMGAIHMRIHAGLNNDGMLLIMSIKKPASEEAGQSEIASHGELHSVTLMINNYRTSQASEAGHLHSQARHHSDLLHLARPAPRLR